MEQKKLKTEYKSTNKNSHCAISKEGKKKKMKKNNTRSKITIEQNKSRTGRKKKQQNRWTRGFFRKYKPEKK